MMFKIIGFIFLGIILVLIIKGASYNYGKCHSEMVKRGIAYGISFFWPSLIIIRTGFPYASTMAWILVLGPPRLRPISGEAPLF